MADLELWSDPGPARWLTEGIHDFGVDVRSIIPAGFDGYARSPGAAVLAVGESVVARGPRLVRYHVDRLPLDLRRWQPSVHRIHPGRGRSRGDTGRITGRITCDSDLINPAPPGADV